MNRRVVSRVFNVTLALLAVTVLAVGCATDEPLAEGLTGQNVGAVENTEVPQPGGKIVYGLSAESNGWNPSSSLWHNSAFLVARNIFDTLGAYDANLQVQPFLAESITHNPEFTRWTVTVRDGVRLHNGKPVTSETLRRDFEFYKSSPVSGGAFGLVESITERPPRTVDLTMNARWPTFPGLLASQVGVVADPDWLATNDARSPVGTGPFMLTDWVPDSKLIVKRNPYYWQRDERGSQLPYLDEIEFQPITEESSRVAGMMSGSLQAMMTANADTIAEFSTRGQRGEFQVFDSPHLNGETAEASVMLNAMSPLFSDVDARRALAYATDKQAVIDIVEHGVFKPANGPYAPDSPWYTGDVANTYPQYDPAAARALVEKVKARHRGFTFSMSYPASSAPAGQIAQLLQQQWAEAGITANLEGNQVSTHAIKAVTGQYEAALWSQFDSPDPLGDTVFWTPANVKPEGDISLNFAHFKSDDMEKALRDALEHGDDQARYKADYQQVQRIFARDVPYVWLFHNTLAIVAANNLVNVMRNTLPPNEKGERHKGLSIQQGFHPLAQVWVKR